MPRSQNFEEWTRADLLDAAPSRRYPISATLNRHKVGRTTRFLDDRGVTPAIRSRFPSRAAPALSRRRSISNILTRNVFGCGPVCSRHLSPSREVKINADFL